MIVIISFILTTFHDYMYMYEHIWYLMHEIYLIQLE